VDTAHNTVQLPILAIEQAFEKHALPGFFGRVRIVVRLLPTAASEVRFDVIHTTITKFDVVKEELHPIASNERVNSVRMAIREHEPEFVVSCAVREVEGEFRDGFLKYLHVTGSEERLA